MEAGTTSFTRRTDPERVASVEGFRNLPFQYGVDEACSGAAVAALFSPTRPGPSVQLLLRSASLSSSRSRRLTPRLPALVHRICGACFPWLGCLCPQTSSMVSDVARPPIMPRISLTRSLIALRAGTKFRTHSAVARVHGCSVVPLHSAHGRVRTQVIDSHTRALGLRSERSTRACVKVVAWRPGARVVC